MGVSGIRVEVWYVGGGWPTDPSRSLFLLLAAAEEFFTFQYHTILLSFERYID